MWDPKHPSRRGDTPDFKRYADLDEWRQRDPRERDRQLRDTLAFMAVALLLPALFVAFSR